MKKKELFQKLEKQGVLLDIPTHEVEELLDIGLDDFDERARRHGYPASKFYKNFSVEQACKEKLIVDRLLNFSFPFDGRFLFWRLSVPGKHLIAILLFLSICIVSVAFWLYFLYKGSLSGSYYSFMSALGAGCAVWLVNRNSFSVRNPEKHYAERRKESYQDSPVIPEYT